ncbi:MAG: metallophosphoesterase [Mariniphaga sp.]
MKAFRLIVVFCLLFFVLQNTLCQEITQNTKNLAKKSFSFGIVTDIQYADAEKNGNRDYRNSVNILAKSVSEMNGRDLAFVITLGDMIDHDYISFDKPLAALGKVKAPIYNVLGNHDFEVDDQYKDQVQKRLKNKKGYFDFKVNDMVFIVLDGSDVSTFVSAKGSLKSKAGRAKYEEIKKAGLNNAYTWNGGFGDNQLKWLEKSLKNADARNKKVVIFCHWPLLPENGTQLWNNREVLSLINNHRSVVAWIAGHHHAGGYEVNRNIHHLILKGMVEAKSETSFGIMDVYPDKLVLRGYGDQNDQTLEFSRQTN